MRTPEDIKSDLKYVTIEKRQLIIQKGELKNRIEKMEKQYEEIDQRETELIGELMSVVGEKNE